MSAPTYLRGHTSRVSSVSFIPNNGNIISASFDSSLRVWNCKAFGCAKMIKLQVPSPKVKKKKTKRKWRKESARSLADRAIVSVSFSADRKGMVSVSADKTICMWQVDTGKCIWSGKSWKASPLSAEQVESICCKSPEPNETFPFTPDSSKYTVFTHDDVGCIVEQDKIQFLKHIRVDDRVVARKGDGKCTCF